MEKSRRQEIEKTAIELLESSGYSESEDIDVVSVAKSLGFMVGATDMDEETDGFIIVHEGRQNILGLESDKIIVVNSKRDIVWKRFTIAHELGHFILHYDKERDKDGLYAHREHVKGKSESENEADYFAANLLLPRHIFMAKYKKLQDSNMDANMIIELLARDFMVTSRTVARRIMELELNGA